ncbi:hypothetical protein PPERSA_11499 [Pseudocohnilembus persalinus]|uniref:Uncharacterized protein n=1 Tax=Pseudocohnilembus persalinus TaxID=266149 RepID=A0A0V0QXC6_PSEPJ|nr:hypothetical protein PPERSA_11499 [Pseudocohnilembus persalinus]|eukprot:KRX06854.1 hypothetical protein PPERSA_11499 [Pseudocohnilembus persalinus]
MAEFLLQQKYKNYEKIKGFNEYETPSKSSLLTKKQVQSRFKTASTQKLNPQSQLIQNQTTQETFNKSQKYFPQGFLGTNKNFTQLLKSGKFESDNENLNAKSSLQQKKNFKNQNINSDEKFIRAFTYQTQEENYFQKIADQQTDQKPQFQLPNLNTISSQFQNNNNKNKYYIRIDNFQNKNQNDQSIDQTYLISDDEEKQRKQENLKQIQELNQKLLFKCDKRQVRSKTIDVRNFKQSNYGNFFQNCDKLQQKIDKDQYLDEEGKDFYGKLDLSKYQKTINKTEQKEKYCHRNLTHGLNYYRSQSRKQNKAQEVKNQIYQEIKEQIKNNIIPDHKRKMVNPSFEQILQQKQQTVEDCEEIFKSKHKYQQNYLLTQYEDLNNQLQKQTRKIVSPKSKHYAIAKSLNVQKITKPNNILKKQQQNDSKQINDKKKFDDENEQDFSKNISEIYTMSKQEELNYTKFQQKLIIIQRQLKKIKEIMITNSGQEKMFAFLENERSNLLYQKLIFFQSAAYEVFGCLKEAIKVYRDSLKFFNFYQYFEGKVIPYKMLCILYLKNNQYEKALLFSKKLLFHSWHYNDLEMENSCYHIISQIYFYIQNTKLQKYFHDKMMLYHSQKATSKIRQTGEKIYRQTIEAHKTRFDDDTIEEIHFDIESFTGKYNQEKKEEWEEIVDSNNNNLNQELNRIDKFQLRKRQKLGVVRQIKEETDGNWIFKPFIRSRHPQNNDKINIQHMSLTRQNINNQIMILKNTDKGSYLSYKNVILQQKQIIFPILIKILDSLIDDVKQLQKHGQIFEQDEIDQNFKNMN